MTAPPIPGAAEAWALFLDIDGTLLPLAPSPDEVRVDPGLVGLLDRLERQLAGALALVSGRAIATIDRLFQPLALPAAGLHGLERRRADGTRRDSAPAPVLAVLRPRLAAYAAARPGLLFEDKGNSLALHYRGAPQRGAAVRRLGRRIRLESAGAIRLIAGKAVVEFQPPGVDKGRAIAAFLAEPPFRGRRPVFVGDDTTDEDGFAAVLQEHGVAVKVDPPERRSGASLAPYRLTGPGGVRRWLEALAASLPERGGNNPA